MQRKLLALVAADMVGFSRLIESNEIEILQRQKQHLATPSAGFNQIRF